jgi:hypothetical protein
MLDATANNVDHGKGSESVCARPVIAGRLLETGAKATKSRPTKRAARLSKLQALMEKFEPIAEKYRVASIRVDEVRQEMARNRIPRLREIQFCDRFFRTEAEINAYFDKYDRAIEAGEDVGMILTNPTTRRKQLIDALEKINAFHDKVKLDDLEDELDIALEPYTKGLRKLIAAPIVCQEDILVKVRVVLLTNFKPAWWGKYCDEWPSTAKTLHQIIDALESRGAEGCLRKTSRRGAKS